jgi:hypothetical protein
MPNFAVTIVNRGRDRVFVRLLSVPYEGRFGTRYTGIAPLALPQRMLNPGERTVEAFNWKVDTNQGFAMPDVKWKPSIQVSKSSAFPPNGTITNRLGEDAKSYAVAIDLDQLGAPINVLSGGAQSRLGPYVVDRTAGGARRLNAAFGQPPTPRMRAPVPPPRICTCSR